MNTLMTALLTLGIWALPLEAAEKFDAAQLSAQFPYDLGPSEVDVSAYPQAQKDNYAVFRRTCAQCHTAARPLNSPVVSKEDWRRYVRRMHLRTKNRPGSRISPADAEAVIEFLAFDSQRRKVERKDEFQALSAGLRERFAAARAERSRIQIEEDKKKARR